VTFALNERGIRVLLLDVEGTTTPISFVTDVLFPYARSHLRAFLRAHWSEAEVRQAIDLLRAERRCEPGLGDVSLNDGEQDSIATYAAGLMDVDSKSTGLKTLQGLIWRDGFEAGHLRGEVFDDVPPALRRWRSAGARTAIYSSGSVLAQKLLFGSTRFGDLTSDVDAHFDTAVGAKRDPASFRRIADALGVDPSSILFLSDVVGELDAARASGCQVALIVRPGNSPQTVSPDTEIFGTFDEIGLRPEAG
jgi:2,3-diketo-5-methylthio-1-phosphopentane phosphatase